MTAGPRARSLASTASLASPRSRRGPSSAVWVAAFSLFACVTACGSDTEAPANADVVPEEEPIEKLVCPPDGITKGPWSLAMTRTTMKVRWEACSPEANPTLVVRPEAGGAETVVTSKATAIEIAQRYEAPLNEKNAPADLPGTYYTHDAEVTGLTPGTCYRYALGADPKRAGRFCTAQPDGGRVHFMAIADTNPLFGNATTHVLEKLLPLGPDFVVHGGDIQYYDSGLETWRGWFPVMQPMLASGALMAAMGNHESEKPEELATYALRFFGDASMGGERAYYTFETGGVHFFALDTETSLAPETPQGTWLVTKLDEVSKLPGYRASIIVLHRPLVTCGDTAQDDASRNHYAPIFAQHKVPLVIQGHMHGYERFELDGITYVTTGGGGALIDDVDENLSRAESAARKASGAFFHAIDVTIDGKNLHGATIDDKGLTRDTFDITLP